VTTSARPKSFFSDLKSFRASLKSNRKLTPAPRQQLLDRYRHYIDQMEPQLPKLVWVASKTTVDVRPVEEYREKEAAGAEYNRGTPDGSRRGAVLVNTSDFQHRSLMEVESTAYHESVFPNITSIRSSNRCTKNARWSAHSTSCTPRGRQVAGSGL